MRPEQEKKSYDANSNSSDDDSSLQDYFMALELGSAVIVGLTVDRARAHSHPKRPLSRVLPSASARVVKENPFPISVRPYLYDQLLVKGSVDESILVDSDSSSSSQRGSLREEESTDSALPVHIPNQPPRRTKTCDDDDAASKISLTESLSIHDSELREVGDDLAATREAPTNNGGDAAEEGPEIIWMSSDESLALEESFSFSEFSTGSDLGGEEQVIEVEAPPYFAPRSSFLAPIAEVESPLSQQSRSIVNPLRSGGRERQLIASMVPELTVPAVSKTLASNTPLPLVASVTSATTTAKAPAGIISLRPRRTSTTTRNSMFRQFSQQHKE